MKSSKLSYLEDAAEQSRQYGERHFLAFGYIATFLLPATAYIEDIVGDPLFNTLYVRLFAGAIGAILLFHRKLPQSLKSKFHIIWVGAATLILPFSFGLILTLNAALAQPGTSVSPIWIYQYLVALFIFVQLMHNVTLSILLWFIALAPLSGVPLLLSEPNIDALIEAWILPFPVYLTALVIGSFTNRSIQVVEREKLRAASAVGSHIAHELRTPLASIRLITRASTRFFPILVDGYQRYLRLTGEKASLSAGKINDLRRALTTIQEEVNYSNIIIDMLLANTSDTCIESRKYEAFFASQAIAEAVTRYPFNNYNELEILEAYTQNDFEIHAPYRLLVHVLFNLIKNAIFYAQSTPGGTVRIFSGRYKGRSAIIVHDEGKGINPRLKHRIFERFFTTSDAGQGAGIGLSFCKMVMEGIGGEIVCDSKEGQYTTFRLLFPEVR